MSKGNGIQRSSQALIEHFQSQQFFFLVDVFDKNVNV